MYEQTSTIRYRVRNKDPLWREHFWPWGLLGLLLILLPLLYGLLYYAKHGIEKTVTAKTKAALLAKELDWVNLDVDGQVVTLSGQGSKQAGDRAIAVAEEVAGNAWGGEYSVPSQVKGDFSEPVKNTVVETKPVAPKPVVAEPVAKPIWGSLTSKLDAGILTLSGTVASQAEKDALLSAARQKLDAPRLVEVIDKLQISQQALIPASAALAERASSLIAQCESGTASSIEGVLSAQCQTTLQQLDGLEKFAKAPIKDARLGQVVVSSANFCNQSFTQILAGKSIGFAVASANLQTSSAPLLNQIAEVAKACPGSIRVEGHTDKSGSLENNMALSEARAKSVVNALVKLGVQRERLVPEGFGPNQPRAEGDTPQAYALNRRIEFHVIQ